MTTMDIDRFVVERTDRWRRFDEMLQRAESSPERDLGPEGMRELLHLYRRTSSDLNQARSWTANPELLGRLNGLVGRGYRFLYRSRRAGGGASAAWEGVRKFLGVDVPRAFRDERRAVAAAVGAVVLGALFGAAAVVVRPGAASQLVPAEFYTQSPHERVQGIEAREERIATMQDAAAFGSQLYTHNIQVSFLAFSLGALTLLGGLTLLFYNGVILGAIATTYVLDGVSVFFFAWVGPHGALELPAITFAGAAGLAIGRALLLPGDLSRREAVRRVLPQVFRIMMAVMLLLVVAGLIEGSFSQFSAKTVPYPLKIAVAVLLFGSLVVYLFSAQREGTAQP